MKDYQKWLDAELDKDLMDELLSIKGKDEEINDRFYQDLSFGTAGIRGVIGAGTNRMNVYTVGRATQGFANYLNKTLSGKAISVAIAYDSRNKGVEFSNESALILAANGIKTYIYKELMPTPALSFAVRHLKCDAGICMTASHNPAKYNGYKAYGNDGCQVTEVMATGIMNEIQGIDLFSDIKRMDFNEALEKGLIEYIGEDTFDAFISAVLNERVLSNDVSNLKIVYTPLNGSGKRCVLTALDKIGLKDIEIVKEQSEPDGDFPTCPYPNPEIKEALQKGLDLCAKVNPDLLLATDPDCDRVGIAVNQKGEYILMTGNEVGVLLLDFIARIKTENGSIPKNPIAVTSIVSTSMADEVAANYGVEMRRVLTGFKYIGDQILELEQKNETERYLLGFEESYGYLKGGYVRDKDAVNASMLICEMASYYKEKGLTLVDVMNELYSKYGYYVNDVLNFSFESEDGMKMMSSIMENLRNNSPDSIIGSKIVSKSDYQLSRRYEESETFLINLPPSNVIEFNLENACKLIVRPSGTEPKIKIYLFAKAMSKEESLALVDKMKAESNSLLGI